MISKADATIVVTGYSVTYDGTAHTAIGTATGIGGVPLAGLDVSGTTHTNAGTYSGDTWSFTDSTGNYNDASGTFTDVISKANATVVVTGYSVTYDGTAHSATGSATGIGGATLTGLDLSGTTHTNAGTYSGDVWSFTDSTGNYNDASGTVNDAIAKADASIDVTHYNVTYDGLAHTATGTATGIGGATLTGLDLSGTTHTSAGTYTDPWTFTDVTGNYNNDSGTVNDAIAKADATVVVTSYSVTYDGTAHSATGSATGIGGATLTGLDLSGTAHTNAGTYNGDAWTFTNPNYNTQSGTVNDAIAKANATIAVTPYSSTYNGTAQTATGTATGVGGVSLTGLVLTGTTHSNAGTYTGDAWTFANANYNDQSGTVNDTIARANVTIAVTPYSVTYDGNAHTATGSAKGALGESLSGLKLSDTTHTNVGNYTSDAWTFTDSTGNYNNASGTIHDVIAKAGPAPTVTVASATVPSAYGQLVTFVANMSTVPTGGIPTGQVNFFIDSALAGTVNVVNGSASFSTSTLTVGSHQINMNYLGDASFQPSQAATVQQTVNAASTTSVLFVQPTANHRSVILNVTVSPVAPGGGVPTGLVNLTMNNRSFRKVTLTNGLARVTVANGTALGKRFKGSFQSNTSSYGNSVSNAVLITRQILRSGTAAAGAVTAHRRGNTPGVESCDGRVGQSNGRGDHNLDNRDRAAEPVRVALEPDQDAKGSVGGDPTRARRGSQEPRRAGYGSANCLTEQMTSKQKKSVASGGSMPGTTSRIHMSISSVSARKLGVLRRDFFHVGLDARFNAPRGPGQRAK